MEDSGINDTDMSLQLDVYEESSEHESDGENSGPENGSDRENSVKESWFLSPKRKWTLDEEVSEEPHGKRIRVSTVKPVLSGHSKRRLKLVFKPDYRLMLVKSIAECSQESILQYFKPSFKQLFVFKTGVLSIFMLPHKTGFTV